MTIKLSKTGKRFNRDWIFRNATHTFSPGKSYAITGPNGSGKSTLLQTLAGSVAINEGQIIRQINEAVLDSENIYSYLTIAAPYVEVIEEMTALEFLQFHQQFKPFIPAIHFVRFHWPLKTW